MAGATVITYYTKIFRFVNPKTEITSKKLHDVASLVNRQSTGCKGGSGGGRLYVHHTKTFADRNPRHDGSIQAPVSDDQFRSCRAPRSASTLDSTEPSRGFKGLPTLAHYVSLILKLMER